MYSVAIHEHNHTNSHLPIVTDSLAPHRASQQNSNGHPPNGQHHPSTMPQRALPSANSQKDREVVVAIPSVAISGSALVIGNAQSSKSSIILAPHL